MVFTQIVSAHMRLTGHGGIYLNGGLHQLRRMAALDPDTRVHLHHLDQPYRTDQGSSLCCQVLELDLV